jgi:CheY-like chemotaxis protein
MVDHNESPSKPRVIVIADVDSNAQALVERVLTPEGIEAWIAGPDTPSPDILVVDVTQLRGDPLADLREVRASGEDAPAIVLAAHFPHSRLRDMFRLGVNDFLLKPYRPESLREAIYNLSEGSRGDSDSHVLSRRLESMREQVRARSEEIRVLSEIGRVVVSLGDLDAILRRVVEAAAFVTEAEEAAIYLMEPDTNEVVLRANKPAGDRYATLQRLRVEDTLVGEVFRTGQPILRQPTLESDPVKVQTGFLVQSVVKVPIQVSNDIVGVLGIYNRMTPRVFNEHHLTLLTSLAHWTGVALEQASLIQQSSPVVSKQQALTAAPPKLIDGLSEAVDVVQGIMQDNSHNWVPTQRQKLQQLHEHLQTLLSLPMATLDADEVQEMIDLPEMLTQIRDELHDDAFRRGLNLIIGSNPPMALFRGDSGRTHRILSTLVTSAIRRTDKGRVVLESQRIEIRSGRSDGIPVPPHVELSDGIWAVVRVSDTSSGLSPDTVRVVNGETTDLSAGQIGPGLSLGEIRMMLSSMGGVMWHEQTPASTTIVVALRIT